MNPNDAVHLSARSGPSSRRVHHRGSRPRPDGLTSAGRGRMTGYTESSRTSSKRRARPQPLSGAPRAGCSCASTALRVCARAGAGPRPLLHWAGPRGLRTQAVEALRTPDRRHRYRVPTGAWRARTQSLHVVITPGIASSRACERGLRREVETTPARPAAADPKRLSSATPRSRVARARVRFPGTGGPPRDGAGPDSRARHLGGSPSRRSGLRDRTRRPSAVPRTGCASTPHPGPPGRRPSLPTHAGIWTSGRR